MCGASSQEKQALANEQQIGQAQKSAFEQLTSQAQSIFGSSSQIFNDLTSAFQPILAAGPGQNGYSPAELANLRSEAITQSGQQYRSAAQAAGERSAAAGGGNTFLPSGATAQMQANIASQGAAQTAGELSQINTNNANIGRQNWLSAANVLSGAPNVFSPATSAGSAATGAGSAAMGGQQDIFGTAQQVNKENNWWQPIVGGVLGGVADVFTGGLSGLASKGLNLFKRGGSNTSSVPMVTGGGTDQSAEL